MLLYTNNYFKRCVSNFSLDLLFALEDMLVRFSYVLQLYPLSEKFNSQQVVINLPVCFSRLFSRFIKALLVHIACRSQFV